ncbi:SDR family oxidoreductase [Hyphococcus sp. DH-69]|uniref:SDR family oxidoreductase n=1 Tax=Hyphococcus formosus TaxID=3143534 RepID=UPI00398A6874
MTAAPTALVTGAAKRLGRAMALRLGDAGFNIAVHYNSSREDAEVVVAELTAMGRKAVALPADLSDEKQTASLMAQAGKALGPMTLLVNSASVFEHDDIDDMTRASWNQHIETNLWAPLKLAQDFAAQAPKNANNLIVNITDQRVLKLTPQFLSYTTSKAALQELTITLAQGLGPKGIRVNAIGPGPTLRNARQSEEDWARQNQSTILGYGADADDICDALLYLVSAKAVTGQLIAVDGGQHLAWRTPDVLVKE